MLNFNYEREERGGKRKSFSECPKQVQKLFKDGIESSGDKMGMKTIFFEFTSQLRKNVPENTHFFNNIIYITLFGNKIKQFLRISIVFSISPQYVLLKLFFTSTLSHKTGLNRVIINIS